MSKSKLIYEIKVVGDVWLRVSAKEFNAWSCLKQTKKSKRKQK